MNRITCSPVGAVWRLLTCSPVGAAWRLLTCSPLDTVWRLLLCSPVGAVRLLRAHLKRQPHRQHLLGGGADHPLGCLRPHPGCQRRGYAAPEGLQVVRHCVLDGGGVRGTGSHCQSARIDGRQQGCRQQRTKSSVLERADKTRRPSVHVF